MIPKSRDANCAVANGNGDCVECMGNYYMGRGGACVLVPMLCLNFDKGRGVCLGCQAGYFLQDGECVYPAMGWDEGCVRYAGSYCERCRDGYRMENYKCARG